MKSKIAAYICSHENWKDDFKKIGIVTKTSGIYTIFNYGLGCDFSNELVQEARGIILDNALNVVCWPFRKFGNQYETYADKIDWKTAIAQQKIDGSIIKLWYDRNEWHWSTNGVINAFDSQTKTPGLTFGKLILMAINYKDIKFDELDRQYTYIFEIVSPLNKIVIDYNITKLYHIGTRNCRTGRETDVNIGIDKPIAVQVHSLDDCMEMVDKLNKKELSDEGYVVVDANYNRVKIKSPIYLLHHKQMSDTLSEYDIVSMILNQESVELTGYNKVLYKKYDYLIEELLFMLESEMAFARALYQEADYNRKSASSEIKKLRYPFIGFFAIDHDVPALAYFKSHDKYEVNKIIKYLNNAN